ncbi:basic leucine zipper transcriptional factor ATF-like 3 isoform X1 [Leuresthes tenuis]|uniref:basic leucine zipper transcriptional factor ATF-like 3 isoform X1 n=1 Tax=Leuresthes tenuis TaxID=355514 RepID=UPI003B50C26B
MSDCDSSCQSQQENIKTNQLCERWECSADEGRRLKRREKNRVAAQKSRKRQTQRADLLHETCELLEQRNRQLRREVMKKKSLFCCDTCQVDSLSEEQHLLTEALRAHEPFCPIMHCSFASSTLQTDNMSACSV